MQEETKRAVEMADGVGWGFGVLLWVEGGVADGVGGGGLVVGFVGGEWGDGMAWAGGGERKKLARRRMERCCARVVSVQRRR